MRLGCDIGEGLDAVDRQLMPLIDMASIACGGHTGDPDSMARTVDLALKHNVTIGAHPSYPDRENFGRVKMTMPSAALFDSLSEQLEQLRAITYQNGGQLHYLKPHGALYNEALIDGRTLNIIDQVASDFQLPLMLMPCPSLIALCGVHPVKTSLVHEAFADRAYTNSGTLVSRTKPHAMLTGLEQVASRVKTLCTRQGLTSETGTWIHLEAEVICVHSDGPKALETARICRSTLEHINLNS